MTAADFDDLPPGRYNHPIFPRSLLQAAATYGAFALLIDSTHKRWFWVTLALAAVGLGLYLWLDRMTPGGLTGGSVVGLWYGVAGFGLMLYAAGLSLLRRVPSWWWLGKRQTWLRGHIWLSFLGTVFVLCHAGFRLGGRLEQFLMAAYFLTLLTGVVGLAMQQFLPRLITLRVPSEAPYGQIPYLCEVMRQKADDLVAEVRGLGGLDPTVFARFEALYRAEVRPFLDRGYNRSSPLAHPVQAGALFERVTSVPGLSAAAGQVATLRVLCEERRQLGEQERLHHLLHGWLLLHVPLSVAALVLGGVHAVMSLYY